MAEAIPAHAGLASPRRPLLAAALVFLAIGFVWVASYRGAWRSPSLLGVLAALTIVQGALHVAFPLARATRTRLAAYFSAQTALVFAFGAASRSLPWTIQLLMILLAETVSVLTAPRAQAAAGLACVALSLVTAALPFGGGAFGRALMHSVPVSASIVAFGALYQRLARARDEAHAALAAFDAAHRRLREFAAQVETLTLASERQRLARELHDTLAQGLAGLVLQLEALEAHLAKGDGAKALAILRHARDRARAALADARAAIGDLRESAPPPLGDAVRTEAARFSAATGIPCALSMTDPLKVPCDVTAHAIRCVSEGLQNVARHARATRATLSVSNGNAGLVVELSDDGIGFDVARAERRAGHFGLLGLRERARLAGGRLEVTSAPGAGTTMRLVLPLPREGMSA